MIPIDSGGAVNGGDVDLEIPRHEPLKVSRKVPDRIAEDDECAGRSITECSELWQIKATGAFSRAEAQLNTTKKMKP